jgi:biotin-dependent carboxylase-like uncharacterized protein
MTAALRVLAPGLLTTVQDLGRTGYQHLGVAVSGALDPVGLCAANALVGNAPDAGALEIAYVGPTLVVEAASARIAFAGASATIEILPDESATSGMRIDGMRSIRLRRGEVVRIGSLTGAAVLYLAVEGGFDIEPVLGSVSTYIRGGMGGLNGRALAAGDHLPLRRSSALDGPDCCIRDLDLAPPPRLRAIAGPQSDYFCDEEIDRFFAGEYTVATGSDRMAMRLDGPRVRHRDGFNIVSDGIAPGSIQIPGSGQPIVLLADRQTTGGYPKIATVISADLPALGRMPIGRSIRFERVTLAAAQELRRQFVHEIETLHDRVMPLVADAPDIAARLYDHNLISGMVDAQSWG